MPEPAEDPRARALRTAIAYHRATQHDFQRFAHGPGYLDWATQPDAFRRYAGSELVALPLPQGEGSVRYSEVLRAGGAPPRALELAGLAQLFFESLAISAWKELGDARWALRVNPSSGNLHPTEAYLLCGPLAGLSSEAGVWHYAPREHALEKRARIPPALWSGLVAELPPGAALIGLASIAWRESWKYGERAYRYCQHDAGHALAALALAAAAQGWSCDLLDGLARDELAHVLGLGASRGPEREEPELLLCLAPRATGAAQPWRLPELALRAFAALDWQGRVNDLSADHVDWSAVEAAQEACAALASAQPPPRSAAPWPHALPAARLDPSWRALARQRRSAVDMDGKSALALGDFARLCAALLPREGVAPFASLPWDPRVELLLFVHRVEGLAPGAYALLRDARSLELLRAALRADFAWQPVAGLPHALPLYLLRPLDARSVAAQLACGQDIAAHGAFSLGMFARFRAPLEREGAQVYPRLFWECGAIGQILYLEAEAMGASGTGIGCFFDGPVHAWFGLRDDSWQCLYQFTVGAALSDARLSTRAAYPPPD